MWVDTEKISLKYFRKVTQLRGHNLVQTTIQKANYQLGGFIFIHTFTFFLSQLKTIVLVKLGLAQVKVVSLGFPQSYEH